MRKFFWLLLAAGLAVACKFPNDLDYPLVQGEFTSFSVEGQESVTINNETRHIDIILQEGGRSDYDEREDYTPVPESFKHYVNMRNRSRIPGAAGGRIYFVSDAQQLRFDKAWMLLWKILSEQSMAWGD